MGRMFDLTLGEGGGSGGSGTTFIPSVSESGLISWTNNGGLPNPDPVNIMGANGVAGFLPDYDRSIVLDLLTSPGVNVVTSGNYTQRTIVAPFDGWVQYNGIHDGKTATNSYAVSNSAELFYDTNTSLKYGLVPVVKGKYYGFKHHKDATMSRALLTFFPILKPDLSQEHIVGYINNKPVYEIAEQQPDGTVTMRRYTQATD